MDFVRVAGTRPAKRLAFGRIFHRPPAKANRPDRKDDEMKTKSESAKRKSKSKPKGQHKKFGAEEPPPPNKPGDFTYGHIIDGKYVKECEGKEAIKKASKDMLEFYEPILPMYPFRHGAIHFAYPNAPDIDRYTLQKEDYDVIKSKAPEAIFTSEHGRKMYSLKRLKAILIKDFNVRLEDVPKLDWPTIIELLRQRKFEDNYKPISHVGGMSIALSQTKWAEILHASPGTIRKWQRDESEDRRYHFDKISPRKWRLPINDLPGEYLTNYKKQLENMRLKQTQKASK